MAFNRADKIRIINKCQNLGTLRSLVEIQHKDMCSFLKSGCFVVSSGVRCRRTLVSKFS